VTAKYMPAHGTLYRYTGPKDHSWDPCRCPQCVAFHAKACKVRDFERTSGNPPSVPIEPVAAHVDMLIASGMSYSLIAARAGVSRNSVAKVHQRRGKFCHRQIAARIRSVKPSDFDEAANRPAAGTVRRVQALYAIGHGAKAIASVSGLPEQTISLLANGYWKTVSGSIAQAIRAAYQQLAWRPGPSPKARTRAAKLGWHSPLDWCDIDDPAAQPEQSGPGLVSEVRRTKRAEVEHLLRGGESQAAVRNRTGASHSYIRQIAAELDGRPRIRTAAAA
jgi:hypothetical protein